MQAQRGRVVNGERLQSTADIRRAPGLADDDQVMMRVVNGEVHVRPARETLKGIEDRLRSYASAVGCVWDELISDRRAEAAGG